MLDTTGYDVRVVATDAFPGRVDITNASEVAADIARLPEVRDVAVVRSDRAMVLVPGRPATEVALLNVSEGAERQGVAHRRGRGPRRARRSRSPRPRPSSAAR